MPSSVIDPQAHTLTPVSNLGAAYREPAGEPSSSCQGVECGGPGNRLAGLPSWSWGAS